MLDVTVLRELYDARFTGGSLFTARFVLSLAADKRKPAHYVESDGASLKIHRQLHLQ